MQEELHSVGPIRMGSPSRLGDRKPRRIGLDAPAIVGIEYVEGAGGRRQKYKRHHSCKTERSQHSISFFEALLGGGRAASLGC